jgi:hypothetical protein
MSSEFRYASRIPLKSPGFTLVIVTVTPGGIGADSAIFNVIDVNPVVALRYR